MVIPISRKEVLANLTRFRDCVSDHTPDRIQGHNRVYRGLLNRSTGDLRFAQRIGNMEHQFQSRRNKEVGAADWEEIEITVSNEGGKPRFVLSGADEKIGMLAKRVLEETLLALNELSRFSNNQKIELDLSRIEWETKEIELLSGWKGSMDRLQAEQLLQGAPVGAYLLRYSKDETDAMLEQLGRSIRGYICTVVEPDNKISDLLFLKTGRGWTIRQDSQDFNDRLIYTYFHSPKDLIASLFPRLSFPV